MSGGASFNEVFFDDVRIPDRLRLGAEGEGWKVALTTLGFERGDAAAATAAIRRVGGTWEQVRALADWLGADRRPDRPPATWPALYTLDRIRAFTAMRAAAAGDASAARPGPEARPASCCGRSG